MSSSDSMIESVSGIRAWIIQATEMSNIPQVVVVNYCFTSFSAQMVI